MLPERQRLLLFVTPKRHSTGTCAPGIGFQLSVLAISRADVGAETGTAFAATTGISGAREGKIIAERKGTNVGGRQPSWSPLPASLCLDPTGGYLSPRMLCCGLLALLLSWTSLAADAAAAVVSRGRGWGAWDGGWSDQDPLCGGWYVIDVSCPEPPKAASASSMSP